MKNNILIWCDEHITCLKEHGIHFNKGIPQLPTEFLYTDIPVAVSTFACRGDISEEDKTKSIIAFFMLEDRLWPRLNNVDKDIMILREYGGVAGFDLSPSVGMLRPRQRLSILINAVYSCYLGINGIKILPNFRARDFGTICAADYFPDDCSFVIGNLGCIKTGYKAYGELQLDIVLQKKKPKVLFVYGALSKKEAIRLILQNGFDIISFSDRRNRVRNNGINYHYYLSNGTVFRVPYIENSKGGVA